VGTSLKGLLSSSFSTLNAFEPFVGREQETWKLASARQVVANIVAGKIKMRVEFILALSIS
jgi:hypothetical protein